jgi:hypothetical protein
MSALHIDTLLQPPSQVSNYERRIFAFFCKFANLTHLFACYLTYCLKYTIISLPSSGKEGAFDYKSH